MAHLKFNCSLKFWLKGRVNMILSDPSCKGVKAGFTMVPIKHLTDHQG